MGDFKTRSTSSSVSSRKFNLDEKDTSDILIYKLRRGFTTISSQRNLCKELDKASLVDPKLKCSRKCIPRGASRIEIVAGDLFDESEHMEYDQHVTASNWLASVGLPRKVYWRRLLLGQFQNLYIISPDHSPNSSTDGSQDSSPTATTIINPPPQNNNTPARASTS